MDIAAPAPAFGAVDLTNCDREPIHIPGSVQPHGILLTLDTSSLAILQIAGDVSGILGISEGELRSNGVAHYFGESGLARIRKLAANQLIIPKPLSVYDIVEISGRKFEVLIHFHDKVFIAELLACDEKDGPDPLEIVQGMVLRLAGREDIKSFLDGVAGEVRRVSAFDRVMVYQFLPDESGHVVAEARADDIDSFLDLHYPASDIPAQARRLYVENWIRLIPDVGYSPSPLHPVLNPVTGKPLDMSHTVLRSVSPLHIEYLQNMDVGASMSLSIVVEGKLWGLVACHHRGPHFLSHTMRSVCELFAQIVSLQLAEKLSLIDRSRRLSAKSDHSQLIETLLAEDTLDKGLERSRPYLASLLPAHGVAIWWDGKLMTYGHTPSENHLGGLISWLDKHADAGVFTTDKLSAIYPPAASYSEIASGLLAISISRNPNDFLLWFRPEVTETVTWAGNPNKPVISGPLGDRLSPRTSFAAWRDTVKCQSAPWTLFDIQTATELRVSILEVVLRRIDQLAREREKAKAQQDFLMAELDHRVKNTLATIQSLVWHSSRSAASLEAFTKSLQQRLQSLSHTHNLLTHGRWEGADLGEIVGEELKPYNDEVGEGRFDISGPKITLRPKAALALSLAIHELTTNAVKYGALSQPGGRVAVSWRSKMVEQRKWLAVCWQEHDGPIVRKPTRSGFGRTVLEKSLAFDIDGSAELTFDPKGVICSVMIPGDEILEAKAAGETLVASGKPKTGRDLQGASVLVVEDGALIALQAISSLEDRGAKIVGPAPRVQQAVELAQTASLDIALLDVDLQGEHTWAVADALAARQIPFAFTTGYAANMVLPKRFIGSIVLQKPYSDEDLIGTAEDLLQLVKS